MRQCCCPCLWDQFQGCTWQLPSAPYPRAGFAISLGYRSYDRWNQTDLFLATYELCEDRLRKRIFEMVKAVGAASHAGAGRPQGAQNPARFQLIDARNSHRCGYFAICKAAPKTPSTSGSDRLSAPRSRRFEAQAGDRPRHARRRIRGCRSSARYRIYVAARIEPVGQGHQGSRA